jgi:WD40 repeat protein
VRVWDAESGRTVHPARPLPLQLGRWLRKVVRYCVRRPRGVSLLGHEGPVQGVTFSRDGRRLASWGEDGTVWVWNAIRGRAITSLRGLPGRIREVIISPDGRRLLCCGVNSVVREWDLSSGSCREISESGVGNTEQSAGAPRLALEAVVNGPETVIQSVRDSRPLAWAPAPLSPIISDSKGRSSSARSSSTPTADQVRAKKMRSL